jgi:hypothetical protein
MKELINLEKKLSSDLVAVRKTINLLKGNKSLEFSGQKEEIFKIEDFKNFKNDPLELADIAEKYFVSVANKPALTKEIKKFVETEGVEIDGKNKGSALGAALRGDQRFIFDQEKKLWSLKKNPDQNQEKAQNLQDPQ